MANELQTTLNEILADKQTNLKPENLKAGVTCLGVKGTLENNSSIRLFHTTKEMNATTDMKDGDIAIVYEYKEIPITADGKNIQANALILPSTLPESITTIGLTAHTGVMRDDGEEIVVRMNTPKDCSAFGYTTWFYGGSTSKGYWHRNHVDAPDANAELGVNNGGKICYLECFNGGENSERHLITGIDVDDITNDVWNYIKFCKIGQIQAYQYDAAEKQKRWIPLPNTFYAEATDIPSGLTVGNTFGPVTGTFNINTAISITNIPALSHTILSTLKDATSLVKPDTYCLLNNITAPENFGDKRYFFSVMPEPGMGRIRIFSGYWDDPDKKFYAKADGQFWDGSAWYMPCKAFSYSKEGDTEFFGYEGVHITSTENTIGELRNMVSITGMLDSDTTVGWWNNDGGYIATNAEIIQESTGKTIVNAGPKASDFYVGDYYVNIFGQKVQGTKSLPEVQA